MQSLIKSEWPHFNDTTRIKDSAFYPSHSPIFVCFKKDRVLLCNPSCTGTHNPPAPASQGPRLLQADTTTFDSFLSPNDVSLHFYKHVQSSPLSEWRRQKEPSRPDPSLHFQLPSHLPSQSSAQEATSVTLTSSASYVTVCRLYITQTYITIQVSVRRPLG